MTRTSDSLPETSQTQTTKTSFRLNQSQNLNQSKTPILDALIKYAGTIRFHMPGHKGGKGADEACLSIIGHKSFECDVTGVPDMDELHEPRGCIKQAQTLAAQLFGAEQTFFMVNGTSGAIHTMVIASLNDGDYLIIPRNIHKSILSAIILAGANPVFVLPVYDEYLGFAFGVEENALINCITNQTDGQKAKAVLLVNPTYYGTHQNLSSIRSIIRSHNKLLLVDEAHGPHFHFHKDLPQPALKIGADAVAQGAHKMIGALTQASYLHIQGSNIDRVRIKTSFQCLTSTSASYLLLASLDAARRQMATQGFELVDRAIFLANKLRKEVNKIPGLYCFGEEIKERNGVDDFDPTKITITVKELGITGYQAESYLKTRMGMQAEMSDLYNILFIISFGNTLKDISALINGLKSLKSAVASGQISQELSDTRKTIPTLPPVPRLAISPRKATQSEWRKVSLKQSLGLISAEVVTCYPPGIPLLYPGEIISQDIIEYLQIIKHLAFGISGPADRTLSTLRVVKNI